MKLAGMSFFQLASQRMSWLGARQSVISENIANADTPNFRSKDITSFGEVLKASAPVQGMAVTDPQHIRSGPTPPPGVRVETDEGAWEGSLNGNNVVLEQQTIKAAEVAGNYRLAAELYRKGHTLLTVAATGIK
ncbi:flagellar basal body rod protein FlgB [Marinovum sp. KMM 9879]